MLNVEEIRLSLVEAIQKSTEEYLSKVTKEDRKTIGQFFTPKEIAQLMGSFVKKPHSLSSRILDPGAGTGILSAAVIDKLIEYEKTNSIILDLYENDSAILPILEQNLKEIKTNLSNQNIQFTYNIFTDNFILSNHETWAGDIINTEYDIIVSNPPYKKISKNSDEAQMMLEVIHGQPNIYFLFMAMASKFLKSDGDFIFIIPRSFTSGLYFARFRNWFFDRIKIKQIHQFVSRDNVFNHDKVLQETIILYATKTSHTIDNLVISISENGNCCDIKKMIVATNICLEKSGERYLYIPTTEKEIDVLKFVNQWSSNLVRSGFKTKTGPVVDFRTTEWMRDETEINTVPLLWAYNFKKSRINFPVKVSDKPQYLKLVDETQSMLLNSQNYILLKRFSSKEEDRRLQCAILLKEDFSDYSYISAENHLNYITKIKGEMSTEEAYGLFVILNSTYLDYYYRILNGSTQVNASEINSIPFPTSKEIQNIGKKVMMQKTPPDTKICDKIIEEMWLK